MHDGVSILLPLTYLGPVSYFAEILKADQVIVEVCEHYIKQTCRNRCKISTANVLLDLVIPVRKVHGNHTKVRDMEIVYAQKWQLNHWRAIESAYSKAPFFLYYREELGPYYQKQYRLLSEFNSKLLLLMLDLIGIDKRVDFTARYQGAIELTGVEDHRSAYDSEGLRGKDFPVYYQVFSDKQKFHPDLSIVDLLFNLGPDTKRYLESLQV